MLELYVDLDEKVEIDENDDVIIVVLVVDEIDEIDEEDEIDEMLILFTGLVVLNDVIM